MSFLSHSKDLAHLAGCWGGATNATLEVTFLDESVLFAQLFEVGVLQSLPGAEPVIVIVD